MRRIRRQARKILARSRADRRIDGIVVHAGGRSLRLTSPPARLVAIRAWIIIDTTERVRVLPATVGNRHGVDDASGRQGIGAHAGRPLALVQIARRRSRRDGILPVWRQHAGRNARLHGRATVIPPLADCGNGCFRDGDSDPRHSYYWRPSGGSLRRWRSRCRSRNRHRHLAIAIMLTVHIRATGTCAT